MHWRYQEMGTTTDYSSNSTNINDIQKWYHPCGYPKIPRLITYKVTQRISYRLSGQITTSYLGYLCRIGSRKGTRLATVHFCLGNRQDGPKWLMLDSLQSFGALLPKSPLAFNSSTKRCRCPGIPVFLIGIRTLRPVRNSCRGRSASISYKT
jgi:hypothetical protein